MKNYIKEFILLFVLIVLGSCEVEEFSSNEVESNSEDSKDIKIYQDISEVNLSKSSDQSLICSYVPIPEGYRIVGYLNHPSCDAPFNHNLFLGLYNAAIIEPIQSQTPQIYNAGAGCQDNYCIWIVGENFEPNAYIDIRTTTGQNIIGTYRGSDRQINISPNGDDTMSIRLRSAFEREQFAQNGLRIWVVNPEARTWADGRTVRRPDDPNDDIIDPPCDPICP